MINSKIRHGLVSNCLFMLRYGFAINKAVYFLKIPKLLLDIVSNFIPIFFLRDILNEIQEGKSAKVILITVVTFAAITFVIAVVNYVLSYLAELELDKMVKKIKLKLGETVMNMPYAEVEKTHIRDFISLAEDGSNFLNVIDNIFIFLKSVGTLAGLFVVILTVQPIILVFVAIVVVVRLITDKKSRNIWDKWRIKLAPIMRKTGYFFKIMKSIEFGKEVRINHLQDWIYEKTDEHVEDSYIKSIGQANTESQKVNIWISLISLLQECSVYLILAYKVFFEGMSIGDYSAYMTSINTFANNVTSVVGCVSSIQQSGLFAKEFRFCIELAQKSIQENIYDKKTIQNKNITLEFKNVSFKYPKTERYILKNISFKISSNESLSIVGVNGAGKTTLVKLICRLYDPSEGCILINNIDIRNLPYDKYIDLISAVFQDYKLFAFSVEENISYSEKSDIELINYCLYKSGLKTKIDNLKNGVGTMISKEFDDSGVEFSGGEGQKLAIARTFYKDAPIVILDEPTSALDPISEYEIYSKFNEITKEKLAIYISHRLSSCRFCDRILVLNDGNMECIGTHNELLNKECLYREMWYKQSQYYQEDKV